ncbi:MAG: SCO1664 family protein [Anaerolineales bacterium]
MTNELAQPETSLKHLRTGQVEMAGRFVYGSNYTFLVDVQLGDQHLPAVYKPSRGERPLWDFPGGTLAQREVAAYVVSHAIGWDFVPPTVLRDDGPAGEGSLQLYVETEQDQNYFTLSPVQKERLRPVAVFDALINNADRKGGHILLSPNGKLWLIDHGICFHEHDKLRTVIWDFAGEPIPERLLADVDGFLGAMDGTDLSDQLAALLAPRELEAMRQRGQRLLAEGVFPLPGDERPYPWPLV